MQVDVGTGLTKQSRLALPTETLNKDANIQAQVDELWKEFPPSSPTDFHPTTPLTALKWAMGIIECCSNEPVRERENEIWYAKSIVQLYRHLKQVETLLGDESILEIAWTDGLRASFQIGVLFREAMFKFEHERDALAGRKCRTGGDNSRKAQARQAENKRSKIIERMTTYIAKGNTIRNAARLAFKKDKLGASSEANRQLWKRHGPPSA